MLLRAVLLTALAVWAEETPCAAGEISVKLTDFQAGEQGVPAGWKTWAPRPEIAPHTYIDAAVHHKGPGGSLAISGDGKAAAFGGWEYEVRGLDAAKWYHFAACYRARGLTNEPVQVFAKLAWVTTVAGRSAPPDYPFVATPQAGWTQLSLDVPAPAGVLAVRIQLLLANAPKATVWWNDISFEEIAAPAARPVTVAAVQYKPNHTQSGADPVGQILEAVERSVRVKTDVIVLGETMRWNGNPETLLAAAEPVPGPTTRRLSEVARARKTYIVAGLVEQDGPALYNTAVLIDREGHLAGKYHKVHLPYTELEYGLTPGDAYPVFQTDFGKVGMMICWDTQFPGPAQALAMEGAEILLVPIWDGSVPLLKTRAEDNQIFLVTSCYSNPSVIVNPEGEVEAIATEQGTAATATIDLARRYGQPGLGNMRERLVREMRDIAVKRPGYTQ